MNADHRSCHATPLLVAIVLVAGLLTLCSAIPMVRCPECSGAGQISVFSGVHHYYPCEICQAKGRVSPLKKWTYKPLR